METQTAYGDPAFASFDEKVRATAVELGIQPARVHLSTVGGRRTATIAFERMADVQQWATWLHWPWAHSGRNGQHLARAFGQWAGFAVTLEADEPLDQEQ